ncbi:MAG: electron transport complex subunit RsxC [Phycisphaeraceae bacterium]
MSLRIRSFRHGVHPEDHKQATADLPIERMPLPARYTLPLSMHIGAPSRAVVQPGDRVRRGQLIAEPGGFVSTALHSPVTGRVVAIQPARHPRGEFSPAIEIEADPLDPQLLPGPSPIDWRSLDPDHFASAVQQAGLVGMGGAAFPSHVKYKLPEGRTCDRLAVNGCECEPHLTCDHRLMLERPEAVIRGVCIAADRLGAKSASIGVELNKPGAIDALRGAVGADAPCPIEIVPLKVKYPQGAEKMLINALFGEEVPAGKLPLELGVVVNNVATMAAMADWFDRGQPLIERVLTVGGPGVERPANLIVPLGTSVREVLAYCGLTDATRQVIMGGPMMGMALASLDVPVLKGTSGLLAMTEERIATRGEYACIQCGQCLEACSNLLNPSRLGRLAKAGLWDELEQQHVADCMECGACTWACPSGVPVVQLIRSGKAAIRRRRAANGA